VFGVGLRQRTEGVLSMSDTNHDRKVADEDVASVKVGDSPSDVESKVLGITHISGAPTEHAEDSEEAADE
jgi:hypothetical protein